MKVNLLPGPFNWELFQCPVLNYAGTSEYFGEEMKSADLEV